MKKVMKKVLKHCFFPVIGFISLLWYLVRVIPKPKRATYPCMRVAGPLASSFIVYVLGLFSSVVFFKKAKTYWKESKYLGFAVFGGLALFLGLSAYLHTDTQVKAIPRSTLEGPNLPMGQGVGIYPGRVVWVHDPNATDENCKNTIGDYWYQDDNTNQDVVNAMLSKGLQMLTGANSDKEAWDAIFRYYNRTHGRGDVGYTPGEKIVIKINLNGLANSFSARNINTSPQICYAVLDQLIRVVGVAQENIGIGDPNFNFDTPHWNKCHTAFPNVKYWGKGNGQTPITASKNPVLFASNGDFQDKLPQAFVDATYMINIPVFKKHHRAGISIACKNHFGSIGVFTGGAWHLHPSLPCPEADGEASNGDYGVYRCFVDIMGHKDLGGKTILYLVDGLWGSTNWGHPPVKFRMPPFNNDWPSSLFLSQDPVAIESVCFDFLYYEFDENHPTEGGTPDGNKGPYPHFPGVDDYLHQAADSNNWPQGLVYDPENDGTPLPSSMGVHEHWNNALEKKYSRNLGQNQGIELVSNLGTGVEPSRKASLFIKQATLLPNYPNPFNLTTVIEFQLSAPAEILITIYNAKGQVIRTLFYEHCDPGTHAISWDGKTDTGLLVPSGVYYCQLSARINGETSLQTRKMVLCK